MGQYHIVVNLDKKQYLHPHKFGDGLKLLEFGGGGFGGTMTGLAVLLAAQCAGGSRGGGDIDSDSDLVGSWAGDRIVVAGDYASEKDAQGWDKERGCSVYDREDYEDISERVKDVLQGTGYVEYLVGPHGLVDRRES